MLCMLVQGRQQLTRRSPHCVVTCCPLCQVKIPELLLAEGLVFDFLQGKRFYLYSSVQTRSRTHSVSLRMAAGTRSTRVRRPGLYSDPSRPFHSLRVKRPGLDANSPPPSYSPRVKRPGLDANPSPPSHSPRVKRLEFDANPSPASHSTRVKRYTFTRRHIFMAWCLPNSGRA
jgi:hypothetical protein